MLDVEEFHNRVRVIFFDSSQQRVVWRRHGEELVLCDLLVLGIFFAIFH